VRHTWALQHDACAGQTLLRSLLYPGYVFFYRAQGMATLATPRPAWGGLYMGTGAINGDLIFMV
jgi:radial spoke head protein 9